MNPRLWYFMQRRRRRTRRTGGLFGLRQPFSQTVQELAAIDDPMQLREYADSHGLSSDEYEDLAGLWDTIKRTVSKAGKAVGGMVQRVWEPIGTAIGQRARYEVDTAGQRIAAQIAPPTVQPTPMPQVVEQKNTTLDTIVKYAPYGIGAILLYKLLSRRR